MTFDEQVKKAKETKLQYRIIRDAIFIILGIIFLLISIFNAKPDKKENKKTTTTKVITTTLENSK